MIWDYVYDSWYGMDQVYYQKHAPSMYTNVLFESKCCVFTRKFGFVKTRKEYACGPRDCIRISGIRRNKTYSNNNRFAKVSSKAH